MICVDTNFILSVINENEYNHNRAKKLVKELKKDKLCINTTIFVETLNRLNKKEYVGYRDKIINFLNSVTIFYLSEDDYVESFKLLKKYKFDVNYSDCTIVTSMIKHNVDYIVSFDNDFDRIKGLYRICV